MSPEVPATRCSGCQVVYGPEYPGENVVILSAAKDLFAAPQSDDEFLDCVQDDKWL